jgi:hypothetical protein
MTNEIAIILDEAGYGEHEPTTESLVRCFLDYVDTGAFSNLDYDEAVVDIKSGEISLNQIIRNMNRILKIK